MVELHSKPASQQASKPASQQASQSRASQPSTPDQVATVCAAHRWGSGREGTPVVVGCGCGRRRHILGPDRGFCWLGVGIGICDTAKQTGGAVLSLQPALWTLCGGSDRLRRRRAKVTKVGEAAARRRCRRRNSGGLKSKHRWGTIGLQALLAMHGAQCGLGGQRSKTRQASAYGGGRRAGAPGVAADRGEVGPEQVLLAGIRLYPRIQGSSPLKHHQHFRGVQGTVRQTTWITDPELVRHSVDS